MTEPNRTDPARLPIRADAEVLENSAGPGNHPTPPESMRSDERQGVPADSAVTETEAGAGRSEVGS